MKLKQWDKIFYLDINLTIHKNLTDLINSIRDSTLARLMDIQTMIGY